MTSGTGQRLDKWLWFARIAKSRTLAAELVASGKVRMNRERVSKPGRTVHENDVITAAVHGQVRVLKVLALGQRRGPAAEARLLYEDMSPPPATGPRSLLAAAAPARREKGVGRPTKRDRRRIDAWTEKGAPDGE